MIVKGNLWDIYKDYDAICCTTNQVVKSNGNLVMGKGIAKQFSDKYKWLSKNWGERLKKYDNQCFFVTLMKANPHLCFFATKNHWKENSSVILIETAIRSLCKTIILLNWDKVLLPCPGCNNGGLNWEKEVYPRIKIWLELYPQIDIIMKG